MSHTIINFTQASPLIAQSVEREKICLNLTMSTKKIQKKTLLIQVQRGFLETFKAAFFAKILFGPSIKESKVFPALIL